MKNRIPKGSYFIVAGMFFALSTWDFVLRGEQIDMVFMALGVIFLCLGFITKRKGNKKES